MLTPEHKVLVVDDMMTMRKIIIRTLVSSFDVQNIVEAADGESAWTKIEAASPRFDLIISDWTMPKMTGLELLEKVRASEEFKKTPFLMVTAEADTKQITEAIQSGVNNYIVKPFTPKLLEDKIAQLVK